MLIRLVVFGGRTYSARSRVWSEIEIYRHELDAPLEGFVLIHGAAPGADTHAGYWAECFKPSGVIEIKEPAKWGFITRPGAVIRMGRDGREYDLHAGRVRNQFMLDEHKPTHALEFPGGPGTADMHERCLKAGIIPKVIT